MFVHTREPHFKLSLLFVKDPMVPRGIECLDSSLDGDSLVLMCSAAIDVRLERVLVESSV